MQKIIKKCENELFWKVFKFMKTCPNWVLNSGKDSYGWWDLNFKKSWKFIKPLFLNREYWCQGVLFPWFQKGEKMDFCWYLLKKRSYDLINVWKKNLWFFRIFTWNIFSFEQKLTKIFTTRIVSFFFRPHSTVL